MDKIVFATTNEGKVKEIKEILGDFPIEVVSMKEMGITADIEENGTTFEENSLIKARALAKLTGLPALADDSGLEVDYLNGEPGIYSARYLGRDTDYDYKTSAELPPWEKNKISHRGKALTAMKKLIVTLD